MKLFIDTTQKEFVCCLFDEDFKVKMYLIKQTKYKVEEIISFFSQIDNIDIINEYFINLGPGSFTGARIALIYIRTLCQIQSAKIYTTNTFELIKRTFFKKKIYINANKSKSYCLVGKNILVVDKVRKESEIDYKKILFNFPKYLKNFTLVSIDTLAPIYASDPQIGQVKGNK